MNSREVQEILAAYERRRGIGSRYVFLDRANLDRIHERERVFSEGLRRRGILELGGLRILELGCGTGGELQRLISLGADPESLHGIDLRSDAVEVARARTRADIRVGDARALPYQDGYFDLVTQFTALSSMPTLKMRAAVAGEMSRVTRRGGLITSYDFVWNPTNRDTVGISGRELHRLFDPLPIELHRVTLAPPIDRVSRRVPLLNGIARRVPILRSHLFAFIDANIRA